VRAVSLKERYYMDLSEIEVHNDEELRRVESSFLERKILHGSI
jgi:hypothetical protein